MPEVKKHSLMDALREELNETKRIKLEEERDAAIAQAREATSRSLRCRISVLLGEYVDRTGRSARSQQEAHLLSALCLRWQGTEDEHLQIVAMCCFVAICLSQAAYAEEEGREKVRFVLEAGRN